MTIKPGDVLQLAIWLDGTETQELKDRFQKDIQTAIAEVPAITGPLMMTELKPGDEQVPPVPDDLRGPDVRLLVAESTVIGLIEESEGYFVGDLEPKDLERLRTILRRVHQSYNPGKPELSTEKCDEYINRNGPDAALEALREQVGIKVH